MSSDRQKTREDLSSYLDGELPEPRARQVQQALRADTALAVEFEALRAVRDRVGRLPRVSAPSGTARAVLERLGRPAPAAGRRAMTPWVGRVAVAAGVLVAVGIGAALLPHLRHEAAVRTDTRVRTPLPEVVTVSDSDDLAAADRDLYVWRKGKTGWAKLPATGGAPIAQTFDYDAANLAGASPPVTNLVINVDNDRMPAAEREVERVFFSNGFEPLTYKDGRLNRLAKISNRGVTYNATPEEPKRVQFQVVMDKATFRRIVRDLNDIRVRQNVAQVPWSQGVHTDDEHLAMAAARGRRVAPARKPKAAATGRDAGTMRAHPQPAGPPATRPAAKVATPLLRADAKDDRMRGRFGGEFAFLVDEGIRNTQFWAPRRMPPAATTAPTSAATRAAATIRQLVVILNGVVEPPDAPECGAGTKSSE